MDCINNFEKKLNEWKKKYGNVFAGFIYNHRFISTAKISEIWVYREYVPLPQKCYYRITLDMFDCDGRHCAYDVDSKEFYEYFRDVLHPSDGSYRYYPSLNSLKKIGYTKEDIEKIISYRNKHNIPVLNDETFCNRCFFGKDKNGDENFTIKDYK